MDTKKLTLLLNHRMEKTSISIAFPDPTNNELLTQKTLLTKKSMLQPDSSLRKNSSIYSRTMNIILPLFLSNILFRLLDPMKDITEYILIPNFQVKLQSNKFLLKSSRSRTKYRSNPRLPDNIQKARMFNPSM